MTEAKSSQRQAGESPSDTGALVGEAIGTVPAWAVQHIQYGAYLVGLVWSLVAIKRKTSRAYVHRLVGAASTCPDLMPCP